MFNSNTPLEEMWVVISALQFISYLPLVNIHFPPNLLIFMEYIQSVHDYNSWVPNAFDYYLDKSKMNMLAYGPQYVIRNINNSNFLLLCGGDIEILVLTLVSLFLIKFIIPNYRFFTGILQRLEYSTIIRSLIQSYLKFCIATLINLSIVIFIFIFCSCLGIHFLLFFLLLWQYFRLFSYFSFLFKLLTFYGGIDMMLDLTLIFSKFMLPLLKDSS